tara:strand:+ start:80 stop:670 length:591 start_codon:yes stop_codon:yes gene_type:complete
MNTIQNKGILWKLLQENGYFNNIDNKYFNQIQNNFESVINIVEKNNDLLSLTEKNKKVINNMVSYLKQYKSNPDNMVLPPQPQQITLKKKDISENLEKKKVEFLNLMHPQEPKEIDFKDNQDQAVEGEINNLLEKAIQERENDLSFFPLEKNSNIENEKNIVIKEENSKNDTFSILNDKLDKIIANQNEILKLIKK